MRFIIQLLLLAIYIILIITAHIFAINFLPYPFNHTNIIFAIFILILTTGEHKKIIWLILFVSYFTELFGSASFGIGTLSLISSLIAANWLQFNIFSNRSFYMIFFSTAIGIVLYRLIFLLLISINNYFLNLEPLPYKQMLVDIAWETALSALFAFIAYIVYLKLTRRKKFLSSKNYQYYGKVF